MAFLKQIREDDVIKEYPEYPNVFPFTTDPSITPRQENDVKIISEMFGAAEFCFIEVTKLITTRNNNLMPFVYSTAVRESRFPLFNAIRLDDYCETKYALNAVIESLGNWLVRIVSVLRSCRIVVLDFSQKSSIGQKCDTEDNSDGEHLYSRKELSEATSKVYAHIARYAQAFMVHKIKEIVGTSKDSIIIGNPLKIISHFGGSHFAPSLLTIYTGKDGTLVFDNTDSYYISTSELETNEWMKRYTNTGDTSPFFCDIMMLSQMKKWNNSIIVASQGTEISPIFRFAMETSDIRTVNAMIFFENGETIISNVNGVKNMLFKNLVNNHKMKGTLAEILSDVHILERISYHFLTLDETLGSYVPFRGDKPYININWLTFEVKRNDDALSLLGVDIVEKGNSINGLIGKIAMACFMSDMEFIMSPMLKVSQLENKSPTEVYNSALSNARLWLIELLVILGIQQGEFQDGISKNIGFMLIPVALFAIFPKIKEMYKREVKSLSDVMNFIMTGDTTESRLAKETLLGKHTNKIVEHSQENYIGKYTEVEAKRAKFDLETQNPVEIKEYSQMQLLSELFAAYSRYISTKLQSSKRHHVSVIMCYDYHTADYFAPFVLSMRTKRLETLAKEEYITIEGDYFELATTTPFSDPINLIDTLKREINYQVVRRYPNTWYRWRGIDTDATDEDFTILTTRVLEYSRDITLAGAIPEVDGNKFLVLRNIHPIYKWKKIPFTLPHSVRTLISSNNKDIDDTKPVWRILKYMIPQYSRDHGVEDETLNTGYFIKITESSDRLNRSHTEHIWSIQIPTSAEFDSNFALLLPILFNGLFCVPIPDELVISHGMGKSISESPFPYIDHHTLEFILEFEIFNKVGSYSIHEMYSLLSAITRMRGAWPHIIMEAWQALILLVYYMIPVEDIRDFSVNDIMTDEADKSTGAIVTVIDDDKYTSLLTTINARLVYKKAELDILAKEIKSNVNAHGSSVVMLVASAMTATAVRKDGPTASHLEHLVRVIESISQKLINNSIENSIAISFDDTLDLRENYTHSIEFMFDIYQPFFLHEKGKLGYLLYRLFEIDPSDKTSVYYNTEYFGDFLDTADALPRISRYKSIDDAFPPENTIRIWDPIIKKHFFCLMWDCDAYYGKSRHILQPDETAKSGIDPRDPTNIWLQLEIEAAYWMANCPKLMSTVYVRSERKEWGGSRWATWLINTFGTVESSIIPRVNLAVIFQSRFKLFHIDTSPIDGKRFPLTDMYAKEFGTMYTKNTENLDNIFFNNTAIFHEEMLTKELQPFRSRWTLDSTELEGEFANMSADGNALDVYASNIEPAYVKKGTWKGDVEEAQASHDTTGKFDEEWGYLPWYTTENFVDQSLKSDVTIGFKECRNIVYVHLPRDFDNPYSIDMSNTAISKFAKWAIPGNMYYHSKYSAIKEFEIKRVDGSKDFDAVPDVTYQMFFSIHSDMISNINDPLDENNRDVFTSMARPIIENLPLIKGVGYVFLVYFKPFYTYHKITKATEEEEETETEVTYEEMMKDKSLNKDSDYHYKIMGGLQFTEVSDIIFQGVYGNKAMRRELYHLFTLAFSINYAIEKTTASKKATTIVCSHIRDFERFYLYRYSKLLEGWLPRDKKELSKYRSFRLFFLDEYYHELDGYMNVRGKKEAFKKEWKRDIIFWHHYGYYTNDNPVRLFMTMSEYYAYTQVSHKIIPSMYDDYESVREKYTDPLFHVVKWPIANNSVSVQFILLAGGGPFRLDLYEQDSLNDTLTRDFCRTIFDLHKALKYYEIGKRMDFTLFMFVIALCMKTELLSYYMRYESGRGLFVHSNTFIEDTLVFILTSTELKKKDMSINETEVMDYMNDIRESDESFLVVEDEEDVINFKDTSNIIDRVAEKYKIHSHEIIEEKEKFNKICTSLLDKKFRYLMKTDEEIEEEVENEYIAKRADDTRLMKVAISVYDSGDTGYRVTTRNYSSLGINIQYGSVDSDVLWEVVKESIESTSNLHWFENGGETDNELNKIEMRLLSPSITGVVRDNLIRSREKIIKELEYGRILMLYLYATSNPTREAIIDIIYSVMKKKRDMRPTRQVTQARSIVRDLGSNEYEIEFKLRQDAMELLRPYALALVYNGMYNTIKSRGKFKPSPESAKLYERGITIHYTMKKSKNFNPLASDTLLQSLMIAISYASSSQKQARNYYMQYKTLLEIMTENAAKPTIAIPTEDGTDVLIPLVMQLQVEIINELFNNTTAELHSKFATYYKTALIKGTDLNVNLVIMKYKKGRLRLWKTFEFINDLHPSSTFISLVLFRLTLWGVKGEVSVFEPAYSLTDVEPTALLDIEKDTERRRQQRIETEALALAEQKRLEGEKKK